MGKDTLTRLGKTDRSDTMEVEETVEAENEAEDALRGEREKP